MATIYWTGNQRARRRSYTFDVTTAAAGTITMTVNGKVEAHTVTGSDTTTTAAAGAVRTWQASLVPEIAGQFEFSSSGATVTVLGPTDGRPVAASFGVTGSAVIGTVTAVTPTSPFDAADDANYSGGSKPGDGDTLIFENTSVPCVYGLAQFTSNTVAFVKRATYTGQIGLADTNPLGFPEYLPTHFETAGTAVTVADNGVACRIKSTAGSAVTARVTGENGGALGAETVEITGTPSSSVVSVTGGSLAFAPLTSQSAVAASLSVSDGVLRTGPGAVPVALSIYNSTAQIGGNYTTLFMDRGSQVRVTLAAAAATSTTNQGGTLVWASTGTPDALTIGSDGVVDFAETVTSVAVDGIVMEEGSTLNNPYDKITRPYTVTLRGEIARSTFDIGTGQNFTVN